MGTDIHGVVQHRWKPEGKWYTSRLPFEDSRNYTVFAVLADVRNGYGFAGSYRHDPIEPISEPRGLPLDYEDDYQEDEDGDVISGVWMCEHSLSWLSVEELLLWKGWDQPLIVNGQARSLREDCDYFIRWLEYLQSRYDGYDIRLVFGFDS